MPTNRSRIKKKLDKVFSRYIRLKESDGVCCTCVTCGKQDLIKNMQAGHYKSRIYMALRYDERNVHPQCKSCNIFGHGKLDLYALYLIDRYGVEILQEFEDMIKEPCKLSTDYLKSKIEYYEQQVKEMQE